MLISFGKELSEGNEVRFGNSSISFDRSDFVSNNDDKSSLNVKKDTRGLSGLAWYIKRGKLSSDFEGFESALFSLNTQAILEIKTEEEIKTIQDSQNVSVNKNNQQINVQAVNNAIPEVSDIDAFDDDDFIPPAKIQKGQARRKINEEDATQHLEDIFGQNMIPIIFKDEILKVIKSGWETVGLCRHDSIILSREAEAGVEYHEAFHRVTEILLSPKEKERVEKILLTNR